MRRLPGQAVWSAGAAGEARLRPDMKGLHYLRALLQRPGADRIGADDQATARLLRRTVHAGSVCRYEQDPDVPVNWLL